MGTTCVHLSTVQTQSQPRVKGQRTPGSHSHAPTRCCLAQEKISTQTGEGKSQGQTPGPGPPAQGARASVPSGSSFTALENEAPLPLPLL